MVFFTALKSIMNYTCRHGVKTYSIIEAFLTLNRAVIGRIPSIPVAYGIVGFRETYHMSSKLVVGFLPVLPLTFYYYIVSHW